jgi:tetratricopeptide (TPR) repeat protein
MTTRRLARLVLAGAALAIAGCGTPPAPLPPQLAADRLPASAKPAGVAAFEVRLRERAETEARQGRLADAATDWEVLAVLQPASPEYRERLDDTRKLIEAAVPERLQRGQQALKRGDLDGAQANYLQALALDPDNTMAADALRAIERERNKRNFLGKPSRLTVGRVANEALVSMPAASTASSAGRNDLEDAAALRAQGELIDAIALLERHLAADRRDVAACQMLAEMYYQQGETQVGVDDANAVIWYQKSLRLDAGNEQAVQRLKQLKKSAPAAGGPPGRASCMARH